MADTTSESYLVVIGKTAGNPSAFSPDLPGCVAIGANREDFAKMDCPFLNRPPRLHSSPSFEERRGNDMHGWTTCSAFRIG